VSLAKPKRMGGKVLLHGTLAPRAVGRSAVLDVYASNPANGHGSRRVKQMALRPDTKSFRLRVALRQGVRWALRVRYADPGVIVAGTSKRRTLVK
jgi:hypothetical protein